MNAAVAKQYQQINVGTASPMELIIMLYDEAIRTLDRAEESFKVETPDRIERIGNQLLHAQDCITELAVSLDMEKGGDIAAHLQRLYDFMVNHLSTANVRKELKPLQDVRNMLRDLREAWVEVSRKEQPAEDEFARMPVSSGIQITT